MRPARPGSAWPGRWPRPGCGVRWWRRRSWNARPGIGSRPTGATPSGWPGCCGSGSCPRCGCPSEAEEAARDLVRAREDARGDLMRARHRLSKLLLRHGLVCEDGAWTGAHERVAARASGSTGAGCSSPSTRPSTRCCRVHARRDRLDAAIDRDGRDRARWRRWWAGCAACAGSRTLTAFGLAVEIGDWHRFTGVDHRLLPRAGAQRVLQRGRRGPGRRSPRPATATPAGCWSRRPGTTAARYRPSRDAAPPPRRSARRRSGPRRARQPPPAPALGRLDARGKRPTDHRGRRRPRARRLVLEPAPCSTGPPDLDEHRHATPDTGRHSPGGRRAEQAARGATRDTAMSSPPDPHRAGDARP